MNSIAHNFHYLIKKLGAYFLICLTTLLTISYVSCLLSEDVPPDYLRKGVVVTYFIILESSEM
jgi:hypothetical protein